MARWGSLVVDERIAGVLDGLAPIRRRVAEHPMYERLGSVENVRVFMEHHVFAVWDFMSLLTALRNHVSCATVPWRPRHSARSRRFVNELMLGEESDEWGDGYTSHLELYLAAMDLVGAETGPITMLLDRARADSDVPRLLDEAAPPMAARAFVLSTWDAVTAADAAEVIGAFAFGRESLIPDMFTRLRRLVANEPRAGLLCDYIDRHIELDGGEHTSFAFELVIEVCGDDEQRWAALRASAERALLARAQMWDGVCAQFEAVVSVP